MDQSLEELRAQRAAIKAHLDWLDRQIAAASTPQQQPDDETPPPAAGVAELDAEHILKSAPQSSVKRAQIGCLLLFLAATSLFLFLFFGLPYLL